jgi:DNA-binding NarL/FixJ family response regulator
MENKYRIFIAEDHTIVREGLRLLLSLQTEFDIVGEAEDGRETIRQVRECKPDLILMDLSMPKMNGLEAIEEIKRFSPKTKILALTIHESEEFILPVLKAGANGYISKSETQEELMSAIKEVLAGKLYLSHFISEKVVKAYVEESKTLKPPSSTWGTLTKREREVLKLIAEGYKSREIADFLCISKRTVTRHRANLMGKLDLHNISALTTYAIEKGLVTRK